MLVETVIAEGAVKGFDKGILSGLAGLDMVEGDAAGLSPVMESAADKLGAVIGGDRGGLATLLDERLKPIGGG